MSHVEEPDAREGTDLHRKGRDNTLNSSHPSPFIHPCLLLLLLSFSAQFVLRLPTFPVPTYQENDVKPSMIETKLQVSQDCRNNSPEERNTCKFNRLPAHTDILESPLSQIFACSQNAIYIYTMVSR